MPWGAVPAGAERGHCPPTHRGFLVAQWGFHPRLQKTGHTQRHAVDVSLERGAQVSPNAGAGGGGGARRKDRRRPLAPSVLRILDTVTDQLLAPSFPSAVVIAGESAGGIGAAGYANRLASALPTATVSLYTNSSWFPRYELEDLETLKNGYALWNATFDPTCTADHPEEPWLCALVPVLVPYLNVSAFFLINLYDPFVTFSSDADFDFSSYDEALRMITFYGGLIRDAIHQNNHRGSASLSSEFNHTYFAPSCFWHVLARPVEELEPNYPNLTQSLDVYTNISIDGVILNQVLSSRAARQALLVYTTVTQVTVVVTRVCLVLTCRQKQHRRRWEALTKRSNKRAGQHWTQSRCGTDTPGRRLLDPPPREVLGKVRGQVYGSSLRQIGFTCSAPLLGAVS